MATSGTTAFNMDLTEIAEEAWSRCGSEMRSGWDLRTTRTSLNLLFADWSNRGINLWTIEQGSQVLTPGTATYTLPADTVDLLEHVIRTGAGVASTQADLTITRISVSTYATIPNKLQQARPIQVTVEAVEYLIQPVSVTFMVIPVVYVSPVGEPATIAPIAAACVLKSVHPVNTFNVVFDLLELNKFIGLS